MSKLKQAIQAIVETQEGQERNMYPYVKQILEVLGHKARDIYVDTANQLTRGIPDIVVKRRIKAAPKKELLLDWIVGEVKDEKDAFSTQTNIKKILAQKERYITIDTEFFLFIDSSRMIIRPVSLGSSDNFNARNDIVILWEDALKNNDKWFKERCAPISGTNSAIQISLKKFREGDTSRIATISLTPLNDTKNELARALRAKNEFLETIRRSTQLLQNATLQALKNLQNSEIKEFQNLLDNFCAKYGGIREFTLEPFYLRGEELFYDNAFEHDRDVERIRDKFFSNYKIAKLAFVWLPEFQKRVGQTNYSKVLELFAIETANMILARILLIRFFEDHGFFGDKRYICNGGIAAFQKIKEYFDLSYTKLLEEVYEKSKSIYYTVFEEMELDWVLGTKDESLSLAIELSLMFFSYFDFTTIYGDILTGIYDRFLDKSQRKKLGEYYTKPSVARYIVESIGISKEDYVLDPACGSGTFLLEVFDKNVGKLIDKNLITYEEALQAIEKIRGNDINPFSSVIAQIQFLWHLLAFKEHILKEGFPKIYITEKFNSLIPSNLLEHDGNMYGLIDKKIYDAVIGNPPYVRPERNEQELPKEAEKFYFQDIKPDKNLFTLFIYRALASWCKEDGYLGYIVPLSLCSNKSNANLRKLFHISKKWRIVEIVDMEAISEHVFDAAVQPIVFIAQNRPAQEEDTVTIKIADDRCINPEDGSIDLTKADAEVLKYAQIWSDDGRILTKINERRKAIIDKLLAFPTFEDIAFTFWVRKVQNKIIEWQPYPPNKRQLEEDGHWEEKKALSGGIAFRGKKFYTQNGMNVYKGENIAAGMIEGDPAQRDIDITRVDDPSLWKFIDILPEDGYAFMQIATNLTATRFSPHKEVFLNTATLFFPDRKYASIPFDLLVLSNVYQFFYAVYARMGEVEKFFSHIYPTNLRLLPWSDRLLDFAKAIEALREPFYEASQELYNRQQALLHTLLKFRTVTFQELCIERGILEQDWKLDIHTLADKKEFQVTSQNMRIEPVEDKKRWRIYPSNELFTWIEVGDELVARSLAGTLMIFYDQAITQEELLQIPVIDNSHDLQEFLHAVHEYDENSAYERLDKIIKEIDAYVADSFGLRQEELKYIQEQMKNDPFLSKLKPKLPFSGKKKRGLLKGLDSSNRYK